VTGLKADALLPAREGPTDRADPRPADAAGSGDNDINAVAELRLGLPADPRGTLLDHTWLRVRSMRIGRRALLRLLQAMDARQATPQFQHAIAALALGSPTGVTFEQNNGTINMNTELRLPGGFRTPLTILDSVPLGDLLGVYGLESAEQSLVPVRRLLLAALAENLEQFETRLAELWPRDTEAAVAPLGAGMTPDTTGEQP
jgi:hypothetical protein